MFQTSISSYGLSFLFTTIFEQKRVYMEYFMISF